MCWSIRVTGKREAVRKHIEESKHLPESVRAVILDTIQADEYGDGICGDGTNGVRVEAEGHNFTSGSHSREIKKLEIERIKIIE